MADVYENREFMNDLVDRGRAVRSVVYVADIATLWVFEFGRAGLVQERTVFYPAEEVPPARLKDKFRRLAA